MSASRHAEITAAAIKEFYEERFRAAVEEEKAKMRAQPKPSAWQRLVNLLPFTVTWKKK